MGAVYHLFPRCASTFPRRPRTTAPPHTLTRPFPAQEVFYASHPIPPGPAPDSRAGPGPAGDPVLPSGDSLPPLLHPLLSHPRRSVRLFRLWPARRHRLPQRRRRPAHHRADRAALCLCPSRAHARLRPRRPHGHGPGPGGMAGPADRPAPQRPAPVSAGGGDHRRRQGPVPERRAGGP